MSHEVKQHETNVLGLNLDPRWLALFMICVTQDGYVTSLLPEAGAQPDYPSTPFSYLGLDEDVQRQFFALFGPISKIDANRKKFVDVAQLFKQISLYHPPACPDPATLKAVVDLLNSLQTVITNTLERFGLE
jgi:hypothetical protein